MSFDLSEDDGKIKSLQKEGIVVVVKDLNARTFVGRYQFLQRCSFSEMKKVAVVKEDGTVVGLQG